MPDETPANRSTAEDVPRYSVPEAARYIRVPQATLSSWIRGRYYDVVDGTKFWHWLIERPDPNDSRLSFSNLIEAYVLNALRKQYHVKMPDIREALSNASAVYQTPHFLRSPLLRATEGNVFLAKLGKIVNVGIGTQQGIPEILNAYLERIEWDPAGIVPARLAPVTRLEPEDSPKIIFIDPNIAFGRPYVISHGIRTGTISERFGLGESIATIAADYDLKISEVEEALRYEHPALAA